jgi:hypothetical protein
MKRFNLWDKKRFEMFEEERKEYLQGLTYKESSEITKEMLSSKLIRQFKFTDNDHPCALSIQIKENKDGRK